jgi:hypothetical protein
MELYRGAHQIISRYKDGRSLFPYLFVGAREVRKSYFLIRFTVLLPGRGKDDPFRVVSFTILDVRD